jgi:flagella basal body P-ring formation protein FlgA
MRALQTRISRRAAARFALSALAFGLGVRAPLAQVAQLPTPKVVIYPGDVIRDDMLVDLAADPSSPWGPVAQARSGLVGKMSRRTLLPGRPIPMAAIENPRVVANGAEVRLVYVEGGLTIIASGAALQDGGVGDVIKIRNSDSGVTVSGTVQPDGAVRVSGG